MRARRLRGDGVWLQVQWAFGGADG